MTGSGGWEAVGPLPARPCFPHLGCTESLPWLSFNGMVVDSYGEINPFEVAIESIPHRLTNASFTTTDAWLQQYSLPIIRSFVQKNLGSKSQDEVGKAKNLKPLAEAHHTSQDARSRGAEPTASGLVLQCRRTSPAFS